MKTKDTYDRENDAARKLATGAAGRKANTNWTEKRREADQLSTQDKGKEYMQEIQVYVDECTMCGYELTSSSTAREFHP